MIVNNFFNLLRSFKTLIKYRSFKKAKFVWYEFNMNVSKLDTTMLIAQIGYFGHHTEKALKHHNRGDRGRYKRDKLNALIKEMKRRNFKEPEVVVWAEKLIRYFDTKQEIYIEKVLEDKFFSVNEEILDFIKTRTTVRFWQAKIVGIDIIEKILETAMHSALSCNRQTIKFKVKVNPVNQMKVGESNNHSMFSKAPILIYVVDDERFFNDLFETALDVGGVCSLILVAAKAFGLSGTWIYQDNYYNNKELKTKLQLSRYDKIYSVIALGYPLDNQEKPPRFKVNYSVV